MPTALLIFLHSPFTPARFIECETNPSTAPVAVWLNGGPGSSSLIGLLTENGQFQTNDDSIDASGNIDLIYNPYR